MKNKRFLVLFIAVGLIFMMTLCTAFGYFLLSRDYSGGSVTSSTDASIDTDPDDGILENEDLIKSELDKLIDKQNSYATNIIFTTSQYSPEDVESRHLDVMAPLGVFDPQTELSGFSDIVALGNSSFGFYAAQSGISEDRTIVLLESPLTYVNYDFDLDLYISENLSLMKSIDSDYQSLDEDLIAYWTSGLMRVDSTFIDLERGQFWSLEVGNDGYYNYDSVEFKPIADVDDFSAPALGFDEKVYDVLLDMNKIGMTSAYTCNGNRIYTMGATANNAFGFIVGSEYAEEINCGLLRNRFRIKRSEKVDDGTVFWVGR